MSVWWNWQTWRTQNPLIAISCGFKSRYRHQIRTMVLIWKPSCFFYCSKSEQYLVWNFIQYVSEHTEERCFVIQTAFFFYSEASAFFSVRFCLIFSAAAFQTVFWENFLFDRKLYCLTELSAFEVGFMQCFLLRLISQVRLFHRAKISSYECGKLSEKKMLKTCPEDDFVL